MTEFSAFRASPSIPTEDPTGISASPVGALVGVLRSRGKNNSLHDIERAASMIEDLALALYRLNGAVDDFWNDRRRIRSNGLVRDIHLRAITAAQAEAGAALLCGPVAGRSVYDRRRAVAEVV